jgi:hypothetical protein
VEREGVWVEGREFRVEAQSPGPETETPKATPETETWLSKHTCPFASGL